MIRKCFTVNPNRTKEEIASYRPLLEDGIYVGVEIFYPYKKKKEEIAIYKEAIESYLPLKPEMVCHLPYGEDGNLATTIDHDIIMDRQFKAIEFASLFGVKKLTLHPGSVGSDLSRRDAISYCAKNIKEICQFAKKYNMYVMLENLIGPQELMRTPEEYFEIKRLVNEENLRFIFDVAHFHASQFDDGKTERILDFIDQIKDDLMHIHVSDNDGTRDMHAPIGSGNIDYASYFAKLQKMGYVGLYSSEVLFNSADDLRLTSLKIAQYEQK